jgi:hypothetical protein
MEKIYNIEQEINDYDKSMEDSKIINNTGEIKHIEKPKSRDKYKLSMIFVSLPNNTKVLYDIDTNLITVRDVLTEMSIKYLDRQSGNIDYLRLTYNGRILDEDKKLSEYSVINESTLHLIVSISKQNKI